jgi:PAS domain S-box-containing protein
MSNIQVAEVNALKTEALLRLKEIQDSDLDIIPPDMPSLLHELKLHKIALEIQNEELQKVHLALKDDENVHQTFLNTIMEGFWINNTEGQFLEVNDTYCQMSGYTRAQLLNMKVSDVEANESLVEVKEHIEKLISTGHDRFDTKHRRKNGSVFDVRVSAQYMSSEGGKFVVFLQDLSQIKSIYEKNEMLEHERHALEVATQQLQTALNSDRNISVAVGLVMGQFQISKDEALKLLRKRARDENLKLNELADTLIAAREALNFKTKL